MRAPRAELQSRSCGRWALDLASLLGWWYGSGVGSSRGRGREGVGVSMGYGMGEGWGGGSCASGLVVGVKCVL